LEDFNSLCELHSNYLFIKGSEMQKMIYTLILTLLVSSSAYAQGNGNFAGPYIGGSIGYNSFNSDALAENINGITFGAVGGYR
jgi:hypothetical protein